MHASKFVDQSNQGDFSDDDLMYRAAIRNFQRAVEKNDPESLYDLVDLNYESDVYWTEK